MSLSGLHTQPNISVRAPYTTKCPFQGFIHNQMSLSGLHTQPNIQKISILNTKGVFIVTSLIMEAICWNFIYLFVGEANPVFAFTLFLSNWKSCISPSHWCHQGVFVLRLTNQNQHIWDSFDSLWVVQAITLTAGTCYVFPIHFHNMIQ